MVDGAGYELNLKGNLCPVLPEIRLCNAYYLSIVPAVATLDSIIVHLRLAYLAVPQTPRCLFCSSGGTSHQDKSLAKDHV